MDQVRGMSLDDDETGKAELRVNLEHKMANLSMARLQATLNEYQARTDEHAALIFHLRRDAAETVETRAATNLLAERLHGCEESVARRATNDELQACANELRSSLLSKVDTTELEAKLGNARSENQLELLHTVSKSEQALKASLNTKADLSRVEQYIESAEARRQQAAAQAAKERHDDRQAADELRQTLEQQLSAGLGALEDRTRKALDAAKQGMEERLTASIKSLEKKELDARDSMLEMMMKTMRQVMTNQQKLEAKMADYVESRGTFEAQIRTLLAENADSLSHKVQGCRANVEELAGQQSGLSKQVYINKTDVAEIEKRLSQFACKSELADELASLKAKLESKLEDADMRVMMDRQKHALQTLQEQVESGHASDTEALRKAASNYDTLSEEVKASKREVLKRIETETAEAIDRTNRLREDVWSSQVAESKASYEAMEKLSKAMRDELWAKTDAALRLEASARIRIEDTVVPKLERQMQGLEEALRLEHQNCCGMQDQIGRAFDAINQGALDLREVHDEARSAASSVQNLLKEEAQRLHDTMGDTAARWQGEMVALKEQQTLDFDAVRAFIDKVQKSVESQVMTEQHQRETAIAEEATLREHTQATLMQQLRDEQHATLVSQQTEYVTALRELRTYTEHKLQDEQRLRDVALSEQGERIAAGMAAHQQKLQDVQVSMERKLSAESQRTAEALVALEEKMVQAKTDYELVRNLLATSLSTEETARGAAIDEARTDLNANMHSSLSSLRQSIEEEQENRWVKFKLQMSSEHREIAVHIDELRSEMLSEANHRHYAIKEVQSACDSIESRMLPERMLEEARHETSRRIAEEAHQRQMAIDSLLHELDVRFVALINGHPSARFEDWRYGTGEAMMADAHARIAHHEQRSRNEMMATVDGKLHQLQLELTERMRHLPMGVAHGRMSDGELEAMEHRVLRAAKELVMSEVARLRHELKMDVSSGHQSLMVGSRSTRVETTTPAAFITPAPSASPAPRWDEVRATLASYKQEVADSLSQYQHLKEGNDERIRAL